MPVEQFPTFLTLKAPIETQWFATSIFCLSPSLRKMKAHLKCLTPHKQAINAILKTKAIFPLDSDDVIVMMIYPSLSAEEVQTKGRFWLFVLHPTSTHCNSGCLLDLNSWFLSTQETWTSSYYSSVKSNIFHWTILVLTNNHHEEHRILEN